jgi:hypothetical protein
MIWYISGPSLIPANRNVQKNRWPLRQENMMKFKFSHFLMAGAIVLNQAVAFSAQDPQTPATTTDEQQQKEKAELDTKAFTLLDQIANDAQLLRLPENRVSVQIDTADLLWDRNPARARTLFTTAGDSIAEMYRNADPNEQRRGLNQFRAVSQLRQDLVLTAARHDAPLAYQLLATTRPPATGSPTTPAMPGRPDSEDSLEQALLGRIAAVDPKMALQNAEQLLDKGQFPRTMPSVLAQLQLKDQEAATKLEDKLLKKLQAANMLSNTDSGSLAIGLLRNGPRPTEKPSDAAATNTAPSSQVLAQSNYVDLLGTVIDNALKATPQTSATNQRGPNNPRGANRGLGGGVGPGAPGQQPTDAQIEQSNARMLLGGLQVMLPQIDQYLPSRAQAVREKLTEVGLVNNQRNTINQVVSLMRQGSSDSLVTAAQTAPPQMQQRIYQQAALKALDEGNPDRARQIASDHLDGPNRDRVLQQVEFRQISEKTEATKLDDLRQTLSSLRNDSERIDLLLQLATSTKQKDPKLTLQLLEQAKQLVNRRATSYQNFEQQLRVAEAFRELDAARSFEVLEPGILQLNELISAASVLSGFEINVFKEGELPLEARSNLSGMVTRYGQALGALAKIDFERAQAMANRFQLTESRILARMSIAQSLLGRPRQIVQQQPPGLPGLFRAQP